MFYAISCFYLTLFYPKKNAVDVDVDRFVLIFSNMLNEVS